MKKLLAILLMLAMLVTCFVGCGDSNKLLVATNAAFEPFESLDKDGNPVGYDIDLMKAYLKASEMNANKSNMA